MQDFRNLVASFLIKNYKEKLQVNEFLNSKMESSFIKRVATGKAAEQYFRNNFRQYFKDFSLLDSKDFGCGFDFKMQNDKDFDCVEVKGLNDSSGNFMLTEKEYNVAQNLQDKYCIYLASNLKEKSRENALSL